MVLWAIKVKPVTGRILSPYLDPSDKLLFCVQLGESQYVSEPSETTGGFPSWHNEVICELPLTKRITLGVHNGVVAMGYIDILTEKIMYAEGVLEETLSLMDYYGRNAGEIRVTLERIQLSDPRVFSRAYPFRKFIPSAAQDQTRDS